ncbi:MAG: M1 family metallopeptidase [Bacteroidota bacterium]
MKLRILILLMVFTLSFANAQDNSKIDPTYRATKEMVNDLVHTKLKVGFDFSKRHLNGEAWLTLQPHFYKTKEVTLDAKAMIIHKVSKDGKDLKFEYKDDKLNVNLGNLYTKGDKYTIYIKYTARPEEVKQQGSAAITDAKGLYFIDPDETDPDKPTQIWTQGETESSSCWFPTIDSPNQKSTQEIFITVPDKFVTLSNGVLKEKSNNNDGTRTDYWKMDQKHAPYLFFMGIGEFSIVKDKWNDMDVDYYVEKEYEPYAKEIFGLTPEMISFFSEYTGVTYPWAKYSQMVGRDYVSGAMENTTSVLHGEMAYQVSGQLVDENTWESVIAHELFHHWFGDLVTTESWSNITVNESFANYSEYLWLENKYGSDRADAHRHTEVQGYLTGENELKDLVRFHYNSREDVFDAVSYNKGGIILHMLRAYVGDDAFRKGLELYLNDNEYSAAEAHHFRLAMEEVTGKDLNWFFNQWYFGNGHPKLDITYDYSENAKIIAVNIKQTQNNVFEFPLAIDVYEGAKAKRYNVWIDKKSNSFSFKANSNPKLVNVGANRTLLVELNDSKTLENYIHQYANAPKYEDRREAIIKLAENQTNDTAFKTLTSALNDKYHGLRILAIEKIDISKSNAGNAIAILENLSKNDPKTLVQAAAIDKLGILENTAYKDLYNNAILNSKSFAVKGSSLNALYSIDKQAALTVAGSITDETTKEHMKSALIPIYIRNRSEEQLVFVADNLVEGMFLSGDEKTRNTYNEGFKWVAESDSEEAIRKMTDNFVTIGKRYKKYGADKAATNVLQTAIMLKQKTPGANNEELIKIIEGGLAELN